MADSSFVSADYYDADHLSEIGAKKLSILIDKYIRDIDFDYFNVVNGLNKR
jgi:hypothetical protein